MKKVLFTVFLTVVSTAAQEPALQVSLNRDTMAIGERIEYNVDVRHTEKQGMIGEPAVDLRDFEVAEIRKFETTRQGNLLIDRWQYAITTFVMDTFTIPPPQMLLSVNGDTVQIAGEPKQIIVVSMLDTSMKDILPEKPGFEGEVRWWLLIVYIVLILAAAGGIIYGLVWWARKQKQKAREIPAPPVVIRSPEEIALEELEKIRGKRLAELGEYKLFHSEVSGVVRGYVESKYRIGALEMPTSELMRLLARTKQLESSHQSMLRALLEVADLVKFAKYKPSPAECEDVLERAFLFIRATAAPVTQKPVVSA